MDFHGQERRQEVEDEKDKVEMYRALITLAQSWTSYVGVVVAKCQATTNQQRQVVNRKQGAEQMRVSVEWR